MMSGTSAIAAGVIVRAVACAFKRRYHAVRCGRIVDGSLTALAPALLIRLSFAAWASLASLASGAPAVAAVIEAEIAFPSPNSPALKAYLCDVDTSRIRVIPIAPEQRRFAAEVPSGRYLVFLAPDEPGAPDVYGAYTQFTLCMERAGGAAASCEDHSPVNVALGTRSSRASIRVDDWYIGDEISAQFDHIRGLEAAATAEPLGAPRFSEYRVAPVEMAAPKLDYADDSLGAVERARLLASLAGGPNFAATASVALLSCGVGCERVAFVDWHTGKVSQPAPLAALAGALPCREEDKLQFRRDSRLLAVTRPHPGGVVTQYFVWKPDAGGLTLITEYQRDTAQFCAVVQP